MFARKKKRPRSTDLVPKEEFDLLREQIKKAQGRVILLIHPFFHSYDTPESQDYLKSVNILLKRAKVPIIIFEGLTQAKYKQNKSKGIFVWPTVANTPELILRYDWISKKTRTPVYDENQLELSKLLRSLGAKKIQVAGMFTSTISPEEEYLPRRRKSAERANLFIEEHESKQAHGKWKPVSPFVTGGCAGATYFLLASSGLFEKVSLIPSCCYDKKQVFNSGKRSTELKYPRDLRWEKELKRKSRTKNALRNIGGWIKKRFRPK